MSTLKKKEHCPPPSDSKTSSSWSETDSTQGSQYQWRPWAPLGAQRFGIPIKRMEFKAKGSPTVAQEIPSSVLHDRSNGVWRIYDTIMPPHSTPTTSATNSRQPYNAPPKPSRQRLASIPETCLPEVYDQGAGAPTKCSSTYMCNPSLSRTIMQDVSTKKATTLIDRKPMSMIQQPSSQDTPTHSPAGPTQSPFMAIKWPGCCLPGSPRSEVRGQDDSKHRPAHPPVYQSRVEGALTEVSVYANTVSIGASDVSEQPMAIRPGLLLL